MSKAEKKEFLRVKFKVKAAESDGDTGFVSGFASVFNNVDYGCDIVHPGAFAKTIKEKNGVIPFLLDHDPCKPAGYSKVMQEQAKGLYYESEIKLFDPEVRQRYELAKLALELNTSMGNSFGYVAVKYDFEEITADDGSSMMVRNIREVKLFEASLVTFPMNDLAGVTGAKSLDRLLAFLKTGGYDLEEVKRALAEQDSDPERAAHLDIDPALRQSMETLRSIFPK